MVNEALKCLCSVEKTKWHHEKFEESKWGWYDRLGNIGWLHGDLMMRSHQIDFGKDGGSLKGGSKGLNVWDWLSIGLGDVV